MRRFQISLRCPSITNETLTHGGHGPGSDIVYHCLHDQLSKFVELISDPGKALTFHD